MAALLLHKWCARLCFMVPAIIFSILLLNFSAVNVKQLKVKIIDLWLMLFQLVVSIGGYALLSLCGAGQVLAHGALIAVLCPVAASAPVVAVMLGADRGTMTTYTIVGNLMVAVAAPAYFSLLNVQPDISFWSSFLLILGKVAPTIGLPFFVIWALQAHWTQAAGWLRQRNGLAFYLWAIALLFTLGQTFDYLFRQGDATRWSDLALLGLIALAACVLQFAVGRRIGRRYGDKVSGGQLLGQKNSAMGIWMCNNYLEPMAALTMAFYSVFQNLFNSWQLWRKDHDNT